jgi:hypothetical protein
MLNVNSWLLGWRKFTINTITDAGPASTSFMLFLMIFFFFYLPTPWHNSRSRFGMCTTFSIGFSVKVPCTSTPELFGSKCFEQFPWRSTMARTYGGWNVEVHSIRWSHVSRGCVAAADSGMNICIFGCQVQQLVASFHTMGLGTFSLCTQPHIPT